MKKVVLFAIALLGCAVMATAQPKAIGGRLGWGLGASYEHYLGEPHFLEFDAEMFNVDNIGFRLDGIYNCFSAGGIYFTAQNGLYAGLF